MRRVGLFGGTFDPPHIGHLILAECARDRLGLDEVRFIPVGEPPHKRRRDVTRAADRVAMTRLAVRGVPGFTVSTLETRRRGPSYTVETLRRIAVERPHARLYLLIGADSLDDLARWRDPAEILRRATVVVARRPGAAGRRRDRRIVRLDSPEIAVSSSLVRARVRAGRSVRWMVPEAVRAYIARRGLYRARRRRAAGRGT
ncbi:MAG: nicotinate-nucleotide adenylyltransferase [Candidatus Eisenbacteria bacterium]|uniref:Probable nicotinate-nucleotide adenylyltransferase n=1 Tax=Eiseniibacteriota bacterium TaxID=2212470 RepID=A0A9D6L788_UNCEI|nr:nicotinate-nucleotide adenylyltransferase [Candidatus Eisenbacteria bacterium]